MVDYVNGAFMVVGAGGTPYSVNIQISDETWNKCDADVQVGVANILASTPIQLLGSSGKGNGIKQESQGVEFHTQTDKRLQCSSGNITKDKAFVFDKYGKGWGH